MALNGKYLNKYKKKEKKRGSLGGIPQNVVELKLYPVIALTDK
jgi:hypothetical protein